MIQTKTEKILKLVQDAAVYLDGVYSVTTAGVPRVIAPLGKEMKASIVYVASIDRWKIFFPFPAIEQKKMYFDTIEEMKSFISNYGKLA